MSSVHGGPAATLGEQLGTEMTLVRNEGKTQNLWFSFVTEGGEKTFLSEELQLAPACSNYKDGLFVLVFFSVLRKTE